MESTSSVGIIGLGTVGRSVADLLSSRTRVVGWDLASGDPYPADELSRCTYAVVCVGTPSDVDGSADVSAVRDAVSRAPVDRILIKSTVSPGTTDRLARETGKSVCFWPEYTGESGYFNPFFPDRIDQVPFVILGGEAHNRRWFLERLLPILGPTKRYFQCTAIEAELIKYAENAFFATKITFVNEFRRISHAFNADWHTVREGWLLDPRVEPMHTAAFEDSPGFSGACLPKDLRAIVSAAADQGYQASLLAEVLRSNRRFQDSATHD